MNKEVRNKIYEMETTPPTGVWDRISAELDDSAIGTPFTAKLKELALAPPAAAWKKIESQLDNSERATRPATRSIPWLKYAAAAAVLAALAWGSTFIFNGTKNANEEVVVNKQETPPPVEVKTLPTETDRPVKEETAVVNEEDKRNDAALEASKRTYAKLNTPKRNKIRNAAGFHFALDEPGPIVSPESMDPATRYIVLMTPDGNFIRMAKKWNNLVCCVAGEEQDAECTDQLKKWKDKMAQSSQTASPGNFGDIMSLLKTLQAE
jgi:hypothetical protein